MAQGVPTRRDEAQPSSEEFIEDLDPIKLKPRPMPAQPGPSGYDVEKRTIILPPLQ
jgi:hypothetical protein